MKTEITAETDLFAHQTDGRCAAFFTARVRDPDAAAAKGVWSELDRLRTNGWRLSVASMFGDSAEISVYRSGFAHDVDLVGAFEGPGLAETHAGIAALAEAGWDRLFTTTWFVGRREFRPVPSTPGRDPRARWAFFALWQWNNAWQAATPAERAEYDAECDIAFSSDVGSGISIAGRHRLDHAGPWHHLGIWEVPDLALLDGAMRMHETVADFKFTTSRHYIGRRCELAEVLGVNA